MDETHQIIRKETADEVMEHLGLITTTTGHHLIAALKRRQIKIFNAVLGKVNEFPFNLPLNLILAPPIYLHRCLEAGMNVNEFKRHGETFLEFAVRKQKVKHVERLLKHPRTKLTKRASNMILKNKIMKKFLHLLFERGMPADPSYVIKALQKNDTELLQGAISSLETNGPPIWREIAEKLKCPILNSQTADLVQTPQGQFYDRQSILQWINTNHTDPLTREQLYSSDLRERSEIIPELIEAIKDATT
jgi:hypothetical protein